MKTVKIRGVEIGAGIPKICVPIVGTAKKEILEQAAALRTVPADMAEWRIDWFENVYDFEALSDVLKELRAVLGDLPLLMTFRTSGEGGEKAIAPEAYAELNIRAARTGLIDLVDVELFTGGGIDPEDVGRASENGPGQAYTAQSAGNGIVRRIIREAHAANVFVVASSHDFDKTPDKEELIRRLRLMQELDADILKIAVMPRCRKDVLTLLAATEEMTSVYADRPVVTMSMAGAGVISRLCGEVFGSAITFGAAGRTSAPGQMDARDLRTALELIHKASGGSRT